MTLDKELQRIPQLTSVGRALVQFVMSLTPGKFKRQGKRWVYRPANFIALCVQHARARSIALSLYCNWKSFEKKEDPILPVSRGRNSMWVRCTVADPRQLAAAARYIEEAFKHHQKSPRRASKYKTNASNQ